MTMDTKDLLRDPSLPRQELHELLRDPFLPRRALHTIEYLFLAAGTIAPELDAIITETIAELKKVAYPPPMPGDPTDDVAVDEDGKRIPLPLGGVREQVHQAVVDGEQVGQLFRRPNGDLAVLMADGPSEEMADTLEALARGYREALKRH
jgi:hypothetical protein